MQLAAHVCLWTTSISMAFENATDTLWADSHTADANEGIFQGLVANVQTVSRQIRLQFWRHAVRFPIHAD